jgi:hypothetical protein
MKKLKRLGSEDVEDRVRQAVASVRLSGLEPSQESIELVRSLADGKLTPDEAIKKLRKKHINDGQ